MHSNIANAALILVLTETSWANCESYLHLSSQGVWTYTFLATRIPTYIFRHLWGHSSDVPTLCTGVNLLLCYKIHRIILIQNPYIFLLPSPSILPVCPPPPPWGPCWPWLKMPACIFLGSMVAAGDLAALSASILPSISHTLYAHSLQPDWLRHVCVPWLAAPTGGGGLRRREGPGWGRSGGGRFGSDDQMPPINFSGHHRAVRGESGTCTI